MDESREPNATRPNLRAAWVLTLVGSILAGVMLTSGVAILPFMPFVAWPLSIVALVVALVKGLRCYRTGSITGRRVLVTVVAAGLVAVVHTMLIPRVWWATSEYIKRSVSEANLEGIGSALRSYCDKFEEYPPSFDALVDLGYCSSKQFITPFDPNLSGIDLSEPYRCIKSTFMSMAEEP